MERIGYRSGIKEELGIMPTALTNAIIFTGRERIRDKALLLKNDTIESIIDPVAIPEGTTIFDCRGSFLSAGLIDLQIAGAGGYLFSADPTAEALIAMTDAIIKSGTTGFLIAIPTNSSDVYHKVIKVVRNNPHPSILGLHIEGPYISPLRRGAHIKEFIKPPTVEDVKALIDEGKGVVKMLTVAPEVCNPEIIELLNDNGIVVAAGHSNASFREAVNGFRWGIRTTTHLFNAMSQLHHRDPGLPAAVFETENVFASIIADGFHVDYRMISIAKKLLKERLFLISDAVEENMIGSYQHVRQNDRFTLADGTLSGSILSMMIAVRNCVENVGINVEEALRMASEYPAKVMKMENKGRIESGNKADLIVFDKNYNVEHVFVEGMKV
jgi:N-acetylglucosamine-6-phosphate deacetylase